MITPMAWAILLRFLEYRNKKAVTEYMMLPDRISAESAYYLCPRCRVTMEREYQSFCDRCGQRLGWEKIDNAKRVWPGEQESDS